MNTYRYNPRGGQREKHDAAQRGFRWQNVALPVLATALIITILVSAPGAGYRNNVKELFVARMQSECDTAINNVKYLSRTASSNSNAQLAVIRSNVYAMDVINQSYASLEGGGQYLIDPALFTSLYDVLDRYYNHLITGNNTAEQLTVLSEQLESLHTVTAALQR